MDYFLERVNSGVFNIYNANFNRKSQTKEETEKKDGLRRGSRLSQEHRNNSRLSQSLYRRSFGSLQHLDKLVEKELSRLTDVDKQKLQSKRVQYGDWAAAPLVRSYDIQQYRAQRMAQGKPKKEGNEERLARLVQVAGKEFLLGIFRGSVIGLSVKGGVNVLFGLLQRQSLMKIIKSVVNEDVLQFTRFLSLFVGLFRGSYALIYLITERNRRVNAIVAGVVASIAIVLDKKRRRKDIALYLLFRSFDILVKMCVRFKWLPYISWFEQFLFGVVNVPIMYGAFYEPDLIDNGYYKWILSMGNLNHKGLEIAIRRRRRQIQATGEMIPLIPCQPHYHEGPCLDYNSKDWFFGLYRAGKVYLPVHLLPLLIFKHKLLLKEPLQVGWKTAKAFLCSCIFLTTYSTIMKGVGCMMRHQLQHDHDLAPVIAGLLTGLSCGFERPSRVSELLLYCCPRGAEAAWNFLKKRKVVKSFAYGEVPIFSVAAAVLISASNRDFKPTYVGGLQFILGV